MGTLRNNMLVTTAPVVKWVGGKRQLIPEIEKYIPKSFTTYCEPFVGGGAVLFYLQPSNAIINDINSELMNLYNVIKFNVDELIEDLKSYKNDNELFYTIRELDRDRDKYSSLTNIQKASRLIFLNKTCYNGLFRVNNSGEFNTPFGKYKNPKIVDEITLKAVSNYFNKSNIDFLSCDYEEVLNNLSRETFVYLDPPYDPISDSSNFTGYYKGGFGKDEQIRLKQACDSLNERGIQFLLSNSSTEFITNLYSNYIIEIVQAKRTVNSNPNKRGEVNELLVRNY